MKPEANAEIIFTTFAEKPASPISSYGFIVSFESESYSAAVVPNGSGEARLMEPFLVRLQFLVAEASPFLRSGASFTFFEQGRVGHGRIL